MVKRVVKCWTLPGLLVFLFCFSLYLAITRIYQVDETQSAFMARILGTHQTSTYFTNAPLWMLGPVSWLARIGQSSTDVLLWFRLLFLGIFWSNLVLMALNTGVDLKTPRGLAVFLGACTLAPLWDYGFEIRHDNLLLLTLLLMWWLGRTRPMGTRSYFLLGFLAVGLEFVAFKAFVYTIPISALFLLFPPPSHQTSHSRLLVSWLAGALLSFALCLLAYKATGLWPIFMAGFKGVAGGSMRITRFSPWQALQRLPAQTPLLLAITTGAIATLAQQARHNFRTFLTWDGALPEAFLFIASVAALFSNPTPFPYNLLNVVPFAFLLSARHLLSALGDKKVDPSTWSLAGGILVFAHLVPFSIATWRHLDHPNDRQELLIKTAESLTDPKTDPVYDAAGLVLTRPSIHYIWYLHSLNVRKFNGVEAPTIRNLIKAKPPAVLIPNYRTEWLPKEDWDYIRTQYVPLADDFWVLGQVLPPGGGAFDLLKSGRYVVVGRKDGIATRCEDLSLDGKPIQDMPAFIEAGSHRLTCTSGVQPIAIWIGPNRTSLPVLGEGNHHNLFWNWY